MKRSGDVTAAAIVLFCGSGLFVLLAVFVPVVLRVAPPQETGPQPLLLVMGIYGGLAAWGIATGVGILQLKNWARISMIVLTAFAIVCVVCGILGMVLLAPMVMKQTPGIPPGFPTMFAIGSAAFLLVPLAIAIWWVALFTRKRVRLEFVTGAGTASNPTPIAAPVMTSGGLIAPAPVREDEALRIPTSILVIAIFLLAGAGMMLLSLAYVIQMHTPNIILGMLVSGWEMWLAFAAMGIVQLIAGIALLRKRFWGIDVTIAYAGFALLNCLLFFVSPKRDALFALLMQKYPLPGNSAASVESMMRLSMNAGMVFSAAVALVALYFLFTQRRAYREVCEARARRV